MLYSKSVTEPHLSMFGRRFSFVLFIIVIIKIYAKILLGRSKLGHLIFIDIYIFDSSFSIVRSRYSFRGGLLIYNLFRLKRS